MKILLKSVEIIDAGSKLNGKKRDLLIEHGRIKTISDKISTKADKIIEGKNLKISIGWFDLRVRANDPGFEHKEDIFTLSKAAAAGGFTEIACLPNTKPVIQTKDVIGYIKSKCEKGNVRIHPMAAVTLDTKGEEITEMIDLHHAGAVAFTDGYKPVWHSDILLKSLQYLQPLNGLLINHAEDKYLSHYGQMNEGIVSTKIGLKGIPSLSEEIIVKRDIDILEYTGGKLHFAHISSPKSLEYIKDAKKRGLQVSCDIAAYQLVLDDSQLTSFDTNFKVNPPLRTKKDIEIFWKALNDGTIAAITSDHTPQDIESKHLEFDLAEFGMIGLETLFPLINTYNKKLDLNILIEKISAAPRKLLGLTIPQIKEGEEANLTIFDTDTEWQFTEKHIKSKSKNTPFVGHTFKGRAIATIFNNHLTINTF